MAIVVDYRCAGCRCTFESWEATPVPSSSSCVSCGGTARRVYTVGRVPGPRAESRAAHSSLSTEQLRGALPGGCHLPPTALRRLAARAAGDRAGEEREMRRQECAIEAGTLTPDTLTGHDHGH
ncbi:hypothetical protein ABCS02_12820 [Microbacterium sp. X-17]|uniref:hypothetical protein n=1 Tax=Microbacterium sp. X-17 TaxID=3144404 RepID=UPI0031F5CFD9